MLISTLLLITGLAGPAAHASTLASQINRIVDETEKMVAFPRPERGLLIAVTLHKILGAAQAGRTSSLPFDAEDAAAWLRANGEFGPALIGGRMGRQNGETNQDFLAMLDDSERRGWNLFDEALTDEDREGLRQLYPTMARALHKIRPGVRAAMVISHASANNFNLERTAAVFGWNLTARGLFAVMLKNKLPVFFRGGLAEDVVAAQTMIAIARYLKMPAEAGFCESKLKVARPRG